jgi:hypothetical protein
MIYDQKNRKLIKKLKFRLEKLTFSFSPSVSPKQRLEFNVKIDAEKVGVYTIMVNVDSAEVKDIEAFVTLEIVEK